MDYFVCEDCNATSTVTYINCITDKKVLACTDCKKEIVMEDKLEESEEKDCKYCHSNMFMNLESKDGDIICVCFACMEKQ